MVLNGGYRGNEGILESINEKKFSATIIIDSVSIKKNLEDLVCKQHFSSVCWRAFTKKDAIINPVLQVGFIVQNAVLSHLFPTSRRTIACSPLQSSAVLFAS